MSKITDELNHAIDKADAVFKASGETLGRRVDEHTQVMAQLIHAVLELDARLDRAGL